MKPKSSGMCNKLNNAKQYPPGYISNTGPGSKTDKGGTTQWIPSKKTSYGSQVRRG